MAKVIMTSDELVARLETLANKKTFYKNKYPYNLGLVAPPKSQKEFSDIVTKKTRINYNPYNELARSFDCNNLLKALLNGYDVNKNTVGYYQANLSNTGDCSEYRLLQQCSNISKDFTKLNAVSLLYMSGHVGTYIAKEVVRNGKTYNVIECTPAFGNGVVYSWVDTNGTRRECKGGQAKGVWTQHGLFTPWVSYSGTTQPSQPTKVDVSKYPLLFMVYDPKTRTYTTRGSYVLKLQQILVSKGYDPKGCDSVFGPGCDKAVRKFQKDSGLVVDGKVGPKTWDKLVNG